MTATTVLLIIFIIVLCLLVLLLMMLLYWRRLRRTICRHHSSVIKSSASSPLAPPRYVPSSQLSSVVDCSMLDSHWTSPLKPMEEEVDLGEVGSEDSVEKPPLLMVDGGGSNASSSSSSPTVSCEQLSTLDCETVDDDDVTSSARHDDVTVRRALGQANSVCRYSW